VHKPKTQKNKIHKNQRTLKERKKEKKSRPIRDYYTKIVTQTVHRPIFVLLPVLRVNKSMRHFCTHIATFWPLPMFF